MHAWDAGRPTTRVIGIRFLLWFLVIALVPVIGPTAWFVLRPRADDPAAGRAHP